MESTGLWEIKGSEGYIYVAFTNQISQGKGSETLGLDAEDTFQGRTVLA